MKKLAEQVEEFMKAAGQPVGKKPGDIINRNVELGLALIREEFRELQDAVFEGPLEAVADAIGDLLYVVTWNGLAWGFPLQELMDEIQRANMAKFGPGSYKDENGKVRKPPGWTPPDIKGVLARFGGKG